MGRPAHATIGTPRRPFGWLGSHPLAADALLAGLLTAVALALHGGSPQLDDGDPVRDPTWWTSLLVVGATWPVMYRRVRPILVLAVVAVAQIACEVLDVVGAMWLGVIVAIYSVGAHTEGRARVRAVVVLGVAGGPLVLYWAGTDEFTIVDTVAAICACAAALVFGDNLRRRRQHLDALAERAERAEREREILARERVAEERSRIARELHDIVAHSVSVMVIQAAAARAA